jgi:phosphoglycerate dehydrogenase-like enzyme
MGSACARALSPLGYHVTAVGRTGSFDLSVSDIVICLLPATSKTENFFDQARFSEMKHGASFVNLSRGAVVCEKALMSALDEGRIDLAILDVFKS